MPCFTQALTRQPVGAAGIGLGGAHVAGAQRPLQLDERLARRVLVRAAPCGERALRCVVCAESLMRRGSRATMGRPERLAASPQDLAPATPAAAAPSAAGRLFAQAHRRHRELHRDGIRLDEVDLHQRQQLVVQRARGGEVAALGRFDHLRPSRRALRSTPPR